MFRLSKRPHTALTNYLQARGLFEAAIAANPSHAESLGNLAVLLHGQPGTSTAILDKIEDLYKRAVHADPANANNFSNFGLFLAEVNLNVCLVLPFGFRVDGPCCWAAYVAYATNFSLSPEKFGLKHPLVSAVRRWQPNRCLHIVRSG